MEKQKKNFQLYENEKNFWEKNLSICGIDEVGRGCLAGPIVTCAAILRQNSYHPDLIDSKKLNKKKLLNVYNWLTKNSTFQIGINSSRVVDNKNIYQATLVTMKQAVFHLLAINTQHPSLILIDAMPLTLQSTPYENIPTMSLLKGESQSASIAAASIIAKVTRDKIVQNMHSSFPVYNLQQHKGYGTSQHRETLQANYSCVIHRKSFLSKILKQGALS